MKRFLLTALMVLVCGTAFAAPCASTVTRTVNPGGGYNHTSMSDCEAYFTDNYPNFVTSDICGVCEAQGSQSSADTTGITIAGITTDADHTLTFTATGDARHNGKAAAVSGRSNYRLVDAGIAPSISNVRIDGLEIFITVSSQYNNVTAIYGADSYPQFTVKNCILHGTAVVNSTLTGISVARNGTFYNNIIYSDGARFTYGIRERSGYGSLTAYGNTIYGTTTYGIYLSDGEEGNVKNNLCIVASGACYIQRSSTMATNGSSDTTGTPAGLQSLTSSEFISTSDFHLASGSVTSVGAGTDLGTSYNTDIDGDSRPQGAAWDIGADEYVASGGGGGSTATPDFVIGMGNWNDLTVK